MSIGTNDVLEAARDNLKLFDHLLKEKDSWIDENEVEEKIEQAMTRAILCSLVSIAESLDALRHRNFNI